MKVCSECNKQFPDDTRFCPECGEQLRASSGGGQSAGGSRSGSRSSGGGGPSGGGSHSGGSRSGGSRSGGGGGSTSRGGRSSGRGGSSRGSSRPSGGSGDSQGAGQRQRAGRGSAQAPQTPSGSRPATGGGGRSDQADLIGRNFFGEYTIADRLGEGGMGAVYLAEQNSIDQQIALKVLHAETAESDEIVQRFHREAKVISKLSHPNIVRVFIFGRTDDDLLYLAMEFIEGVELREKLDGTPIDELRAIKIMKQVCSALAAAHDLQIIHRDLKPENILLTEFRGEEDYVKILDFGIAKIKHPEGQQGPQLTQAGIVYGTPEYLSPEQAQAEDLDHRTDIYALGCMLFEMMTGRVPFDAEASVEILKQKVFEDPPRPTEHAPVAPTMEQIIMRAMAKDREERFDSALEMFDALVARENELQRERKLSESDTYVPGGELTGVHRAVDPSENPIEAVQEQAAAAQQAVVGDDQAAALEQTAAHNQANPGQLAESGTSSTDTGHGGGANPGGAHPSNPGPGPSNPGGGANPRAAQTANPRQGQAQYGQQNINNSPTQPHQSQGAAEDGIVRYLLIGAVVVLGVAVLILAVYLTYMLIR